MAASPVWFFLLLMTATFVVPFIVAIRMPNLRSLLMFALVMFAVQFALATIAVQFADTALLKDEAQAFVRFFLWSALGLGSAAGAVRRWIWLARQEQHFHLPENVRSGGQFLRNWPAGKDDSASGPHPLVARWKGNKLDRAPRAMPDHRQSTVTVPPDRRR